MIQYNTIINGIPVQAHYTEESVEKIFLPLLRRLSALEREKGRRILAMRGKKKKLSPRIKSKTA